MARGTTGARPELIAPGVYRVATGHGLTGANVYLVRSRAGWVLIDTAWPHQGQLIRVPVSQIRIAGRNTQGVTLFRTSEDEHVVSVERLAGETGDEADENEGEPDTEG